MSKYIKLNIIPIIIEIIFIVSCFIIPKEYFIYTNFLFYMLLVIYFYIKREFSFKEWLNNIKSGKKFWKQVIITALLFMVAFIITTILENVFSNYNTGTIGLKRDSWLKLTIFAVSTILLPAIAEETFYRKSIISFKSKGILLITTVLGMLLYALEHMLEIELKEGSDPNILIEIDRSVQERFHLESTKQSKYQRGIEQTKLAILTRKHP